ncbi:MAG: methyltransferase domain-containing protein [Desulfuromonadaceae bacterium]|nr:methyltransferase domain-containing protein [Desulfuromonadaceae bacterium]
MGQTIVQEISKYIFKFFCLGFSKGEHITRYYMFKHFSESIKKQRDGGAKVLSISGSEKLCRILGYDETSIVDASYPEYNIFSLPFDNESFDAVVSDQVLEHVEGNPQDAINETLRVLKPGGLMVHATCFINPIHGAPSDYWRFTPEALALLSKERTNIVEVNGWGNIFIWLFFAFGVRYEKIPNNRLHPFNWLATFNQKRLPVTTWVVAEKI